MSERENAKPDGLAGIFYIYFVYSYAQPEVEEKDIFMNKLKHSYTTSMYDISVIIHFK